MYNTNFDLAPPAKIVDGLVAVPIDIQQINAALIFDGATSSGTGDATLEFVMGTTSGNPIFDLRQTITAAWLDEVPLSVTKLAFHNFGGGPNAELRIIESVLAAGSRHTLRVTYTLGTPQASMAGSYLPSMTWSVGPRLAFNFGFTDLGAGRYLEAWLPANLIFDQFEINLQLQVLNTSVQHTIITNGTITTLDTNHWSVAFPAHFTALSALLEIHAGDTVASMTDTIVLPVSGTTVTIEVWKLISSPVDLGVQINNLKTWLTDNEQSTGPYLHGHRFVAFLNVGGMEYEGGTTSGVGSLRHETFHSWWARGVKPAGQPHGWWDEAWTVYNDRGASGSLPFDFTEPPVELCPSNPWIRTTASGAYTDGERFFEGVAALIGVANLRSMMSEFYRTNTHKPVTTQDIEAFLVCHSGQTQLVDAYHRFVYGFPDLSPTPDLWLRDDAADPGSNFWEGRFWDSPDLWIRNTDDDGTIHQPVRYGQDNWFYAKVRNRSTSAVAHHFLVTFNVKPFAGLEFQYPVDFLPCIAAVPGFDLAPGQSKVVKARWPAALIPPAGTHACWLAAVLTRSDKPTVGLHVWEHNNLSQKNLTIVNLAPDERFVLPFVINRFGLGSIRTLRLELIRPADTEKLEVSLLQRSGIALGLPRAQNVQPQRSLKPTPSAQSERLDCGGASPLTTAFFDQAQPPSLTPLALSARQFAEAPAVSFPPGRVVQIPIRVREVQQLLMGLQIHVPPGAISGQVLAIDLVQRDEAGKRILGGLTVIINVH